MEAPSIDPAVLAKALGAQAGFGGLDLQKVLQGLEPPAKIAKTGPDFSSLAKAAGFPDISAGLFPTAPPPLFLGQPAPQLPPQLAQFGALAPQPEPLAADAGPAVTLSSHKCRACHCEGKLSLYCVSCGHCGNKCNECGADNCQVGALDAGNNMWYCKFCWIKSTPAGVEGPFAEGDKHIEPATASGSKGKDGCETVAAPSANDEAKKSHWAQVFATLQQVGQSHQALEYAQCLRKLRGTIQELFGKYKEALASEDELLQSAYTEALEAYKAQQEQQEQQAQEQAMQAGPQNGLLLDAAYKEALDLQVQAHHEVEAHAAELQRAVQGAHHQAAVTLAAEQAKLGRPTSKPPRRPGQAPCKFYMRTGECAYGITCKWDHPDRSATGAPAAPAPAFGPGMVGFAMPGMPGLPGHPGAGNVL